MQLVEGIPQQRVIVGVSGVNTREYHRLGWFIAGQWLDRVHGIDQSIAHPTFAHALKTGGDIAYLPSQNIIGGAHARVKCPNLNGPECSTRGRHAQLGFGGNGPINDTGIGDYAFVSVVMRIEYQGLQGRIDAAFGGRHITHYPL